MVTQATPLERISIRPEYLIAKRMLDILFTLLILLPLCIIVVIVSLLICLDSKDPGKQGMAESLKLEEMAQ
jgi:lipopolysaccharide/colanic/teichoic acid biosynthesis glycosyltransferase